MRMASSSGSSSSAARNWSSAASMAVSSFIPIVW
jgi:hypothetical protein